MRSLLVGAKDFTSGRTREKVRGKTFCAWMVAFLAIVLATGSPAHERDKCKIVKQKACTFTAGWLFRCNKIAVARGLSDLDRVTCKSRLDGELGSSYLQAESRGTCPGTVVDLGIAMDVCDRTSNVAVGNASDPRAKNPCDARKLRAMGDRLWALLSCDWRETSRGTDPAACVSKATKKFDAAMGRVASRTDCTVAPGLEDTANLGAMIDTCRTNINNTFLSTTTITSTTSTTSTT